MKITCFGSGVFGVAIATLLAKNKNNQVFLWTPDSSFLEKAGQESKLIFDGKTLEKPKNIYVTDSIEEAMKNTRAIFLLVASLYVKELVLEIKKYSKPSLPVYIGSKGLLDSKPYFSSKYVKSTLNTHKIAFFAGPNLAADLILGAEVFITVATKDKNTFDLFVSLLPKRIHLERMKEEKVLELASVLKNIYAIGAGMAYARSPFPSTIFSYLTECYKEYLQILYSVLDYPNENIYTGTLGDFFLTGSTMSSRNFSYGRLLIKTKKEADLFLKQNTVEGYIGLKNIHLILRKKEKFPFLNEIYRTIFK